MLEMIDRFIEGLKKAREVAKKVHDAELQSVVADLMLNSAELKVEMAELREQNVKQRAELEELRRRQDLRSKLEYRDGRYYLVEPVKGYSQGPFCTRCFDRESQLITLLGPGWQPGIEKGPGVVRAGDGTGWTCPECIRGRR